MATVPLKRRKLDHSGHHMSPVAPEREDSAGDSSSGEEVSDETHPSKPAQSKSKQTQDGDDGAIFTGGLYKSNMFKLQVDEMLEEVRPDYQKRMGRVDDDLRKLKRLIEGLEDLEPVSIPEASKFLQKSYKITAPYPSPMPDPSAAYRLAYSRPSSINVVGSYMLKTMVMDDGPLDIDMVIVMPASIFQEKDYLNYRYFYKRAFYLACIAGGLQTAVQNEFSLTFEHLSGNTLHPILVAKPHPKETSTQDYRIRIIPAAPQSFFAESKLRPGKNAIRPKDTEAESLVPTPFYNSSLRSDCNYEPYLKLLHSASKQSEGYKDACILGRIWLRQRGFGSGLSSGGFGHFEWAALTALLLTGGSPKGHGLLSPAYSSYQMFKAVIQFISSSDFASKPLLYKTSDFTSSKSDFPVFYDGLRGHNLLYKMTPWSYSLLREEARASLAMLNDSTFDQFESTFIIRTSLALQRFDCLVRVHISAETGEATLDHRSRTFNVGKRLYSVLKEGLGDRVKLINLLLPCTSPWSTKSSPPSAPLGCILVSVVFDSANINRLVDHGPAAEDKKRAAKFQQFWGDKAELRRFKDGSILESLVWPPQATYSLFREIVTYLLQRHFKNEVNHDLQFIGDGFEKLLPGNATSSKAFETLKDAFRVFEKNIRSLESLPLQLRQLSPISPQLRYSSLEAPSFSQVHPLKAPADVLIQFEGSGRWPDDIVAIQRTKIAFLLKIGSLLEESDDIINTRLGLENEDRVLQNCAYLDVIYESGAVFRLRIQNDREQSLAENLIKDKSTDGRTRDDAILALSTFKRIFNQSPLHTQSILTHCTRFPLLSPTIRLLKLWFSNHLLSGHISDEVIELLAAHTFLQPYPWRAPSSAMTGFLRTLLFISRWDWRSVPLIVDFTGTMKSADVTSINTRLEAWRKIDPAMNRAVLFAASNHDLTGTAFTDCGPSKMVAARMTALARSAFKVVKSKGLELDPRSLFATSTIDYDFLIHLAPKFITEKRRKDEPKQQFKNLEVQGDMDIERIGYSSVSLFIAELERLYSHSVVFFHKDSSSSIIAGLWNPQTAAARPFKVNLSYANHPVEGKTEGQVAIDKSSILSEIARLGGDMVAKIESDRKAS